MDPHLGIALPTRGGPSKEQEPSLVEWELPGIEVASTRPPADDEENEHDYDDPEDQEDNEGPRPTSFHFYSTPPQIDSLSLPSPIFGASFSDLLAPFSSSSTATGPGTPRSRTSSRLSFRETPRREPTLIFSQPRSTRDTRTRRPGREEDVFISPFPGDDALNLSTDLPTEWLDEEWDEVTAFLAERGYQVQPGPIKSNARTTPAVRNSDSLALNLRLVPIDDSSFELDVLEHLSSAAVKAHAQTQDVIAQVPVVGFVPLSSDWTACLVERWNTAETCSAEDFPRYAKDVAGALAFIHANHIAHLGLDSSAIAVAPSPGPSRYTLSSFASSILLDPLSKGIQLTTGEGSGAYPAPETTGTAPYNPFQADLFSLGRLLNDVAKSASVTSFDFTTLLTELGAKDPRHRSASAAAVVTRLKEIFP